MPGPLDFLILLVIAAGVGWWWRRRSDDDFNPYDQDIDDDEEWEWDDEPVPAAPKPARASLDVLQDARRRESVEHGIIILRWLRNLQFGDKSIQEFVDTGTPQEKTEAAGMFAKLVDAYNNIMDIALPHLPGLKNNVIIQQAENAKNALTHAIKLMASLEKPISMSQSRQISADAANMDANLDQAGKESLNKLADRIESAMQMADTALEHYVKERAAEEEREAESAIEAGMNDRRRRRRRRRPVAAQGQPTKQRKTDIAMRADDYILGQGIYAPRKSDAPAPQRNAQERPAAQPQQAPASLQSSISLKDLAMVEALGKALADTGKQAQDLKSTLAVADVNPADKLKPDDANLSAQDQLKQQRDRDRNNPNRKNRNGPAGQV